MTGSIVSITDHPRFKRVRETPLTKIQLSAVIGFSTRWIELRHKDGLPVHYLPNGQARYWLAEVQDFIAEWIGRSA